MTSQYETSPYERHYLTSLFEPRSVAIVGATEKPGKVGEVLISNMRAAGYRGELLAVNPKYDSVHGVRAYPSVDRLPHPVDLVVVATPAVTVPGVIAQCGAAGVRAAMVITAGFSETGPEGARLERKLMEQARRYGVRMLGPNCLGMLRPGIGLNATFDQALRHGDGADFNPDATHFAHHQPARHQECGGRNADDRAPAQQAQQNAAKPKGQPAGAGVRLFQCGFDGRAHRFAAWPCRPARSGAGAGRWDRGRDFLDPIARYDRRQWRWSVRLLPRRIGALVNACHQHVVGCYAAVAAPFGRQAE